MRWISKFPKHHVCIVVAAVLAVGLLFLIANRQLPIVRNSFVYAKTAKNIIDHGFDPFPVIADSALFHGKPVGFSLLSVPLVLLLGLNAGVKVASFLGTAFFLCVAYFFFKRLNRQAGIDARFIPLELALLFLNPLTFYQFWSAYPDSLFAGLVLLAFVLADVIVMAPERDTRVQILLLGLVIYAAILTRLYGLILGIAVPIYLLLHLRPFLRRSTYIRAKIALLALVFLLLGGAVVLARLGRNPTLNFAIDFTRGGGSGYSGYVRGLTAPSGEVLIASIIIFIVAFLLNFHFSLFFLLKRSSLSTWPLASTCFAGIYILGLLPFSGTSYNMRFFLPIFPFVVVAIVSGILITKKGVRRAILVAYGATAIFLILNYNVKPVYEHFQTFNQKVAEPILNQNRRLDNLRIDQHLRFSRYIERINGVVESGGVLYWAASYYDAATHGVIEGLGIRHDIEVQYVYRPSEIPAIEQTVYLAGFLFSGSVSEVQDRFSVTSLRSGVFRLVPLRIELTRPVEDAFDLGEPVPLKAKVSALAEARIVRVEFLIDDEAVAVDTQPPYEFNWHGVEKGRHVATAKVHDSNGNIALSDSVAVFVDIRALERSIAQPADDAEELLDGSMYLNSSDVELIKDSRRGEQIVGLRFLNIRILKGTQIRKAYLQFKVDEVSTEQPDLIIQAELAGDAVAFTNVRQNISSRKRTSASVNWSPEPWNTVGERSERQRTPDLSALIQEVVSLPDWQAGNAVVFIISGSGRRVAESYDGDPQGAPRLYIERR